MFIIPIYLFSEIFPGVSRGPICSCCTWAHSTVWPPLGGILDEWRLLVRISIDDSRWSNFQIENFLYLNLKNNNVADVLIAKGHRQSLVKVVISRKWCAIDALLLEILIPRVIHGNWMDNLDFNAALLRLLSLWLIWELIGMLGIWNLVSTWTLTLISACATDFPEEDAFWSLWPL